MTIQLSSEEIREFLKNILQSGLKTCDIRRVASDLRANDIITAGELEKIQSSLLEEANSYFYGILDRDPSVLKLRALTKVLQEDKTHGCHQELSEKIDRFLGIQVVMI